MKLIRTCLVLRVLTQHALSGDWRYIPADWALCVIMLVLLSSAYLMQVLDDMKSSCSVLPVQCYAGTGTSYGPVSVCHQLYSIKRDGWIELVFWHKGFFWPMLHWFLRKFRHLQKILPQHSGRQALSAALFHRSDLSWLSHVHQMTSICWLWWCFRQTRHWHVLVALSLKSRAMSRLSSLHMIKKYMTLHSVVLAEVVTCLPVSVSLCDSPSVIFMRWFI